jgi:hypothetical protein
LARDSAGSGSGSLGRPNAVSQEQAGDQPGRLGVIGRSLGCAPVPPSIGPRLVLDWSSIGPRLVLDWSSTVPRLLALFFCPVALAFMTAVQPIRTGHPVPGRLISLPKHALRRATLCAGLCSPRATESPAASLRANGDLEY